MITHYPPLLQQKSILKVLFISLCLCTIPLLGMAQHKSSETTRKFKADNFGFNAIDIRQGRFLYSDSIPYRQEKFYDHFSVGLVWHYDKIVPKGKYNYGASLNYGIFLEKELSKCHALRLLLYEGIYDELQSSIRMTKFQGELHYSFNWTRFFGGYNPYRKFDAITSLGVGTFYTRRQMNVETGPLLIAGAGLRMQLSPLFIVGIEPYVALSGDGIDHSGSQNFHKYDFLYGADLSLSYTLHNELARNERKRYAGATFVDFGIGAQFEPNAAMAFFSSAGPKLKLGLGHWFSPGLALRVAGNLSSSDWRRIHVGANIPEVHPAYDLRMKNVLANGGIDFIFSPYHFFSGNAENDFDVNLLVGWEYGWMIKTDYDDLLKCYYDGFSAGMQFRYAYDRHTALYLEPRVTFANYSIPYLPPYDELVARYRDYLFSLTAGYEFSVNDYRFCNRHNQPSEFAPHIKLSAQGGPSYLFVTKSYEGYAPINYTVALTGEMHLAPYSGVRLMADYSRLSDSDIYTYTQRRHELETSRRRQGLVLAKYGYLNISADYLLNVGTMLQGYDNNRRWSLAFAMGPVFSMRIGQSFQIAKGESVLDATQADPPVIHGNGSPRIALGAQLGIPVGYRLGENWEVLFEPRARFFEREYINGRLSGGLAKVLNAQVGIRYTLDKF